MQLHPAAEDFFGAQKDLANIFAHLGSAIEYPARDWKSFERMSRSAFQLTLVTDIVWYATSLSQSIIVVQLMWLRYKHRRSWGYVMLVWIRRRFDRKGTSSHCCYGLGMREQMWIGELKHAEMWNQNTNWDRRFSRRHCCEGFWKWPHTQKCREIEIVGAFFHTNRVVLANFFFASVHTAEAIYEKSMGFLRAVKTATKKYPRYLSHLDIAEKENASHWFPFQ